MISWSKFRTMQGDDIGVPAHFEDVHFGLDAVYRELEVVLPA
jgi:hypothetical protein